MHKSGISNVVASTMRAVAAAVCLGSVPLTTACSAPTLPSDFPAFKLTSTLDDNGASEPGRN
jgi:hypothetical protein